MRRLAIFSITLYSAVSSAAPKVPSDIVATWGLQDSRGNLTLRLNENGRCEISTFDLSVGAGLSVKCTFWVHGSRINFRVKGLRDGEGINRLDIERDRESDSLIVHGSKAQILRRLPNPPVET